jgi:16S rRNA (guanine(966)-N(2))-methyltransferase RsmD
MLRIIGGKARGRRLALPVKGEIRPTSDFVREALFNILGRQDGNAWLDVYAGTGAVALEALSRGAARAVFIESSRACCEAIRANIEKCGFSQAAEVLEMTAEQGIRLLAGRGRKFEIVFADPPYGKGLAAALPGIVGEAGISSAAGMLVIQHSLREKLDVDPGAWIISDVRKYGDTEISILIRANGGDF